MLRKDDAAFKKVVDAATAALYKSGEGQKLYDKWFSQKIPPKGINLNMPIESGVEESSPTVGFPGPRLLQGDVGNAMQLRRPMRWPGRCTGRSAV